MPLDPMQIIVVLLVTGLVLLLLVMRRIFSPLNKLRADLRERQAQWHGVVNFLNVFARGLGSDRELKGILPHIARYAARILRAESVGIYQFERHDEAHPAMLYPSAVSGPFPLFDGDDSGIPLPRKPEERLQALRKYPLQPGEGLIGQVADSGESVVIRRRAQVRGVTIPFAVDTCIAAPITLRDQTIGVLCAVNRRFGTAAFDRRDRYMLKQLAFQVGIGIDMISIYEEHSNQQRLVQELEFGREIQQSLLPPPMPRWDQYAIAAYSEPALEVAGDNYDFVEIDDDRLMLVVADATGKGVPACMLSAMARSFVRSLAEGFEGMEEFLTQLNGCIFRDTDKAHFLTMAVLMLDRRTHVCEYASAGHTPLLIRFPDGTTRSIAPDGPALGLLPNELGVSFDTLNFAFQPGTSVMIFSDGFSEALNLGGEEFGLERLEELWRERERSPEEVRDLLIEASRSFSEGQPQHDDRTLLVISRQRQPEP